MFEGVTKTSTKPNNGFVSNYRCKIQKAMGVEGRKADKV